MKPESTACGMKPATQPVTHTPGPWNTDSRQHDMIYIGPDFCKEEYVAEVWASDETLRGNSMGDLTLEDWANARLISAAPELLEALKEAKELIRFFHGDPAWEIYDSSSPEMKRLNAAIAKATGAEGTQGEQR